MAADEVSLLCSDPLADDVFALASEGRKLQIIHHSIKLSIFDEIDKLEKSETADNIASKLGYDPSITERLLNALVCFKLLKKECGVYILTESSKKYLVSTKPTSMVPWLKVEIDFVFPLFNALPSILKEGPSSDRYHNFLKNEADVEGGSTNNLCGADSRANGSRESRRPTPADFQVMQNAKLVPIASAVTQSYDFSLHRTLVDLGGGSGFLTYEFIKVYEKMKAIVFDLPDSTELAVQKQPENTKSRVKFMSGDFFKDEKLPVCDLMILSNILHNWSDDKIDVILKKVFASINPGGCILLLEKCLNDDKTGPYDAVMLDAVMMVICDGRERTFLEYKTLLQNYGFTNVMWKKMHGRNCQDVFLAFKPVENK